MNVQIFRYMKKMEYNFMIKIYTIYMFLKESRIAIEIRIFEHVPENLNVRMNEIYKKLTTIK